MTNLSKVKKGQTVEIIEFQAKDAKSFSARLGFGVGEKLTCVAKPGPIVLQKGLLKFAIGKNISKEILVREL